MKKVLITGANGFIAKNISRILKNSGCYIIGTSRIPNQIQDYDEIVKGVLGWPLNDVFEKHKIDAVVHCAYDKQDIDNNENAEGTRRWAEQAEKNNVGLQIFMSSLSADEEAVSPYGQKKYELEKWFIAHNQVVFRLGLVIGNGGLFQTMIYMVQKSPILPLIDIGKNLTYISDISTISMAVRDCIINGSKFQRGRVFYLQQGSPVFVGNILKEIRKQYGLFCIFMPIPRFIFSFFLILAEKLKSLDLGININNLKGLRQFNDKKFKSDLHSLGYLELPIEILINKIYLTEKDQNMKQVLS